MQQDFINRGEFDDFKDHVDERFDEQKEYVLDGFKAMDRKIDFVYGELKEIKEVQQEHTKKLDRIDSSLTLLTKIATKIADKI